jgi:GT2 family glycosyltransferase
MTVAVAISTRDRPEALARCLESLAAADLPPTEVVVSDQSDGPETADVVAATRGLSVRRVVARPGGLGAAQNDAVAAATAPVVAVLDDDCVADRRWLAVVAETFERGPESLGLLAGRVLPLGPPAPGLAAVSSRTSAEPATFAGRCLPWDVGSGNNFAVRRSWWERIGGNDERLGPGSPGLGGVDMDLFYRLVRAGAEARYEPEALVLHERATVEGRHARRFPYGYGMGACCAKWRREGDRYASTVLRRWLTMRGRLLAGALRRGNSRSAREELIVLRGTVAGLMYGYRLGR